jgi:hypothetical protein
MGELWILREKPYTELWNLINLGRRNTELRCN